MELLALVMGLIGIAFVGRFAGKDSRPRFDDEPHREI